MTSPQARRPLAGKESGCSRIKKKLQVGSSLPADGAQPALRFHPIEGYQPRQASSAQAELDRLLMVPSLPRAAALAAMVLIFLAAIARAGQVGTADSAGSSGDPSLELPFTFDGPPVPVAPSIISR